MQSHPPISVYAGFVVGSSKSLYSFWQSGSAQTCLRTKRQFTSFLLREAEAGVSPFLSGEPMARRGGDSAADDKSTRNWKAASLLIPQECNVSSEPGSKDFTGKPYERRPCRLHRAPLLFKLHCGEALLPQFLPATRTCRLKCKRHFQLSSRNPTQRFCALPRWLVSA